MRSVFVKILLWFSATLIVCLAGLRVTSQWRRPFAPGRHDFMSRSISFQLEEAQRAYEQGGPQALGEFLNRLRKYYPGTYTLVDRRGIDLVTGADLSGQLQRVPPPSRWDFDPPHRMMMAWPSRDGKYRLVVDAMFPPGPLSPIPYYLWLVVAASLFCWGLAVYLASPLRGLKQTVERFGRGDLAVRANTKRRDEFGNLARAFDVMADRIETLLTAERRLLQDVSHELRSPLARLEFAVELARNHPDRDRSLDRIQKEVDRLSTLVSELLQVTRAESDPQTRNLDRIELADLLRNVIDVNMVEAEAHNCRLVLMPRELVVVHGDRELLRRAIENVLRNAIRFAPAGTDVEISLTRQGEHAAVTVRDYGPGVPEASLLSLFKPFFRVEPDRSRNSGGGVGLGLSIAQRAVEVHQGTIRAQNSKPGLLVEIELPLVTALAEVEHV